MAAQLRPDIEFFAARLNATFQMQGEDGVALVKVQPAGRAPHRPQAGFSLVFQGSAQPQLQQKTYAMESAGTGVLDIFLVPLGCNQAGMQDEAVFN